MNNIARKNLPSFSQLFALIGHHRFSSFLLAIAAIWLLYALSVPHWEPVALSDSEESRNVVQPHTEKAFFLLKASQTLSAEEYETRAGYIVARLKEMRDSLDVDNVFVFSFCPESPSADGLEERLISNTFEVNRDDVTPHLYLLQDLSSYAWEHVRNAQLGVYIASSAEGYGLELYGPEEIPIGFLGASSLKKGEAFLTIDETAFKEFARKVEIALAYPWTDFQALQAE